MGNVMNAFYIKTTYNQSGMICICFIKSYLLWTANIFTTDQVTMKCYDIMYIHLNIKEKIFFSLLHTLTEDLLTSTHSSCKYQYCFLERPEIV